ncbi:MAG: membrane protein insertase YidC, partial [Pseudomonadota bacterium]
RQAPFFGWIKDLSQPDPTSIINLFGLIPIDLPPFLLIGVWPIIMGLTMYLQQKLNPAPADPVQAKIFMFLPFIFTIMLAGFPAGLVIYWAWNNALSILQQWVIMRRMGVKIGGGVDKQATPSAPAPSVTRKKKAEAEEKAEKPKKKAASKSKTNGAKDPAEGDEVEADGDGDEDDSMPTPDLSRARTVKGEGRSGKGRRSRRASRGRR